MLYVDCSSLCQMVKAYSTRFPAHDIALSLISISWEDSCVSCTLKGLSFSTQYF
jgi:hypothetical protein